MAAPRTTHLKGTAKRMVLSTASEYDDHPDHLSARMRVIMAAAELRIELSGFALDDCVDILEGRVRRNGQTSFPPAPKFHDPAFESWLNMVVAAHIIDRDRVRRDA